MTGAEVIVAAPAAGAVGATDAATTTGAYRGRRDAIRERIADRWARRLPTDDQRHAVDDAADRLSLARRGELP